MEEIFTQILNYVIPIGGGITVGAVLLAIGTAIFKGIGSKLVAKLDVQKIEDKAVEKGVDKIKKISFSHSIQPLVKSELQKVVEVVDQDVQEQLKEVNANYLKLVNAIECLAKYFDNSIGVSEEAKENLHKAIAECKGEMATEQIILVEQEEKTTETLPKETDTTPLLER